MTRIFLRGRQAPKGAVFFREEIYHLDHGKNAIVAEPGVTEVIVAWRLTGKDGVLLAHLFLDKRMTHTAANTFPTLFQNRLGYNPARTQVVEERRSGYFAEIVLCNKGRDKVCGDPCSRFINKDAPVRITIECNTKVCSRNPGQDLHPLHGAGVHGRATAVGIWASHWLLAFSTFLFFSLALVKRYGELAIMKRVDGDGAKARAYELSDAELLAMMGVASGFLAVLVLALYIASDKAQTLYAQRGLRLWFLCPLLLYWISHVWLTAHRGRMHDDPVVFAIGSQASRILLFLMALIALMAL